MLSGQHQVPKEISSIDTVKKIFVEKMKGTYQSHSRTSPFQIKLSTEEHVEQALWTRSMHFRKCGHWENHKNHISVILREITEWVT